MSQKRTIANGKRSFTRKSKTEKIYRRTFVLATEGCKTEPSYFKFSIFSEESSIEITHPLRKKTASNPRAVLKSMQEYLKNNQLTKRDQAWLVIDKDQWSDNQLQPLYNWVDKTSKYHRGLALSNPKFELWLLLHFEDSEKLENLKNHLPQNKTVSEKDFPEEGIRLAIQRASDRDNSPCEDWPKQTGTTVYRLVEEMLNKKD